MSNIGVGIVGCGYFGSEFARILNELEGTRVVAVYGGSKTSTALVAEETGCDIENKLGDLVSRNDVDAIVVASPNHVHREAVIAAAKNKRHVFCEKPIALNLDDCNEMIALCRTSSVVFMAGHIMHFFSGIKKVKEWVSAGVIGRPLVCHSERTGWEEKQTSVSWKKIQSQSGGHLFHHIHELDLLQSLVGDTVSVSMVGGNLAHVGDGYGDEDDILLLTLRFTSGAFGTMQYGSGFRWGEHYIKINGSEGAIKIDFKKSAIEVKLGTQITTHMLHDLPEENEDRIKLYLAMDGGVIYGDPSKRPPAFLRNAMRAEMACFRDAILGRPIPEDVRMLFNGEAARSSIATAHAAMVSMKERGGSPVHVKA